MTFIVRFHAGFVDVLIVLLRDRSSVFSVSISRNVGNFVSLASRGIEKSSGIYILTPPAYLPSVCVRP